MLRTLIRPVTSLQLRENTEPIALGRGTREWGHLLLETMPVGT
jgi:hypothetical protein